MGLETKIPVEEHQHIWVLKGMEKCIATYVCSVSGCNEEKTAEEHDYKESSRSLSGGTIIVESNCSRCGDEIIGWGTNAGAM